MCQPDDPNTKYVILESKKAQILKKEFLGIIKSFS